MRPPERERLAWHRHLAGTSPWHRTDPRARLFLTALLSGMILAADDWRGLLAGACAVAALFAISGTGPSAAWGALRPFRFLLLFTAALQLFFTPGPPLVAEGFPVTGAGAASAVMVLARLCAVILASSHLVLTTSPLDLSRCLGWAISPGRALGLPVRDIQLVMALGFQFFPVLLEESHLTRAALESRGISLRHPRPRLRLRALLMWMLALLFGMIERSARLAVALESKGFGLSDRPRHRFAPWNSLSTLFLGSGLALFTAMMLW